MIKVCLFNFPPIENFHGYHITTMDPLPYFNDSPYWSVGDFFWWGWNGLSKRRNLTAGATEIDRLYRARDPGYMRFAADFVNRYHDYDVIVMANYNCIHPEILYHELKKPIKILGFVDDPLSTYMRGIPYLWAFDGAFYISPSYNDRSLFNDALERWGCSQHAWWPLVPYPFEKLKLSEEFFANRSIDIAYIGTPTNSKTNRLIALKKHFGARFRVHGRWPFWGYNGIVRGIFGKPIYPHRVTALSTSERTLLYHQVKIGINMHMSETPMETGNMRMYEVPAHGAMLLCGKAALDAHQQIFVDGREAVYYDSVEDAIEKAEFFLSHAEERLSIARAGCERFWQDYEWERNLLRFLSWASNVPRTTPTL